MKEGEYRTFKCPNCCFEERLDYIAIMGESSLHLSTAVERRLMKPFRWRETL